jgi:copper chaperone
MTTLTVPDMTCGHCKAAVEEALLGVPGVERAHVDLDTKTVAVDHAADVKDADLHAAVEGAGYSVAG